MREFILWTLFAAFAAGGAILGLACCVPALTPAQESEIVIAGTGIGKCQLLGRETNSYAAYDRCMAAEGLRDGGSDARD